MNKKISLYLSKENNLEVFIGPKSFVLASCLLSKRRMTDIDIAIADAHSIVDGMSANLALEGITADEILLFFSVQLE